MDTSPNLPIPRLRLTRHSPPSRADTLNTPTAGPSHSRTSPEALRAHFYDEEDAEATPRMPTARIADSPEAAVTPTLPLDTPAARLRMVLARVPNNRSPPRASTSRLPQPSTPSEPDSDLDPPYSITATPSIAKESLREIFSHALRGSETTPQKPKRRVRRNSIGSASEVDPSPRVEHVQQERTRNKGKRRSMSDEEAEHLSNLSRRSEESTTTSRSARWDALTAVLTGGQSSTMPPTPPPERMITNMTMPPSDTTTEDNATLLREIREFDRQSSPVYPSGTPTRTLQMSGQLNGQSNLLEGDSEMRQALGGIDSYDGDSTQNGHAPPFPPTHSKLTSPPSKRPTSWSSHKPEPSSSTRPASASARPISWSSNPKSDPVSPGRPLSWNSHSKSHSAHNLQMPLSRRGSEELEHSTSSIGSSRASSSSQSAADYKERHDDLKRDQLRERERLWNHPQPKSPARPQPFGHGRDSPVHTHSLSRKGSAASLNSINSTEDGRSSRASSVMSQAEQRERVKELETERNKEREHGWNKPKHTPSKSLTRSSSSLNLRSQERPRTLSSVAGHTPPRADSEQSFLSPHSLAPGQPRRSLSRRSSTSSLHSAASGNSRAPSPALSYTDAEPEEEREVEHERERNWNSPRPKWGEHHHGRSPSPLPASAPAAKTASPSPRERKDSSASLSYVSGREHTQSLRTSPAPTASRHIRTRTQSSISFDVKGKQPLTAKSLVAPRASLGPPSRSPSPVRVQPDESQASDFRSRFGWTFPVNRTPLPPLELDTEPDSPAKPRTAASTSTPSRMSLKSPAASHIPRPSSALGEASAGKKRGHKRSITELSKPTGAIPPPATPPGAPGVRKHEDEEDGDSEISIEIDTGSDPEPEPEEEEESRFPSFHADSQMDVVYASDEDSPPATSTPTARPVPLPPPSPWSLVSSASETPFTTPSSHPNDTHANDGTTSKAPRPETPPQTPAETISAPIFSLQTPPRRSPGDGSSGNSTKLEFKTPSPPHGMPDLPDPPSFSTDDGNPQSDGEGENDDNTPVMTSAPSNFTMMKTPRPPGAWAATPDVRRPEDSFPGKTAAVGDGSSASSVLVNTPDGQAKVDVVAMAGATPGPGGSNATATWPRTPAPPGAWLQTPGGPASVRRRSILKVRFDVESETTVSDVGDSSNETKRPALPAAWNPNAEQDSSTEGALAMPPVPVSSQGEDRKPARAETPKTPPPTKADRPFRSPGSVSVRIVDAYGRETKPEDEQPPRRAQESRKDAPARPKTPERKTQQPTALQTPRSRSAVRIVDAMGREIEDPEPAASSSHELSVHVRDASMQSISALDDEGSSVISVDMPTPTTHNEALELVRENVKTMKKEARQAEKSYRELALDSGRARALQDASNKARDARRTISQELQRMEGASADGSRASRYAPLKESMRRATSRLLPPALSEATVKLSWSRGAWLFWAVVLIQLGFCLAMYRLSNMRARRLFLTTYYDPFYSDLYLVPRGPSAANPSAIPPYPSWYEIPAMMARKGWQAVLGDMWSGAMCALSLGSCGQSAPDVWNNGPPGQLGWPPA